MTLRRASIVIAATALFSAACGGAWAADRPSRPVDFIVRSEPVTAAPNAGKALKYEATKGRLGFTLNIQQPLERPAVAGSGAPSHPPNADSRGPNPSLTFGNVSDGRVQLRRPRRGALYTAVQQVLQRLPESTRRALSV